MMVGIKTRLQGRNVISYTKWQVIRIPAFPVCLVCRAVAERVRCILTMCHRCGEMVDGSWFMATD